MLSPEQNSISQKDRSCQQRFFKKTQAPDRISRDLHTPVETRTNKDKCFAVQFLFVAILSLLLTAAGYLSIENSKIPETHPSSRVLMETQKKSETLTPKIQKSARQLPKILWIYASAGWQAEHGNILVYFYHLKDVAARNGFQVRVVDAWNAYDWISEDMTKRISNAIQNTKIDQTVGSLLKLALLIENGGIMIGNLDTILVKDSLQWVQDMFGSGSKGEYTCEPSKSQIFMKAFQDQKFGTKYAENFIAALPQALLLYQAFTFLEQVLLTEIFPENEEVQVLYHNPNTNVNYFEKNSIQHCVSQFLRLQAKKSTTPRDDCKSFGMQGIVEEKVTDWKQSFLFQNIKFLKKYYLFQRNWKKMSEELMINVDCKGVKNKLQQILVNIQTLDGISQQSVMYRVLNAPGNKEVFILPLPPRELQLCLIVMDDLKEKEIAIAEHSYREQTFQNWRLVLFAKDKIPQVNQEKVRVLESRRNQVRNIELAVTKVCDSKGYAVLLHFGDRFNSPTVLQQISAAVRDRQMVGAAINLEYNGEILRAKHEYLSFSRSRDGIINPNIAKMEGIMNHFRIFAIESFRYLPQFDWMDMYGEYFEDRFIFLMSLLELINQPQTRKFEWIYIYKKYAPVFNVPQNATLVTNNCHILTTKMDGISRQMMIKTRARFDVEPIAVTIDEIVHAKVSFSKLLVFNPGDDFVPVNLKEGPDIIPRVIHQVWLGGKMPISKSYFYEKAKKMYPHYEMKLWGEANITRENFPLTYEVIMNMLDFQKNRHSGMNKLASLADIMRHQILYHEGGFWRDAGMNLLKPVFDLFLKYKLVVGAQRTSRHRWNQGMCFYANAPKVDNLFRITKYQNINKMRIYSDNALQIAGPFDFRQVVNGYEEYDPEILLMSFEVFYPGQINRPPLEDICTKWEEDYIEGESYEFEYKRCYLLPHCEKKYPYAIGLDHNCFGVSWMKKNDE